ncbi:protein phosphatase 1F-like [Penaeus indicus]|uniref:protein phosphatase 1F-like n=1 Tax=Penaeus indicus TaxID=29960 RepID=UPI00300CA12D
MECGRNYASGFLKYLSDFVANIRPDDPLPVRAPSYKVTESEIDGQILDIVHHYLNSRYDPEDGRAGSRRHGPVGRGLPPGRTVRDGK